MSPVAVFSSEKVEKNFFQPQISDKASSGSSQEANGINGSLRPVMPD
jgi:hypothetical protein